MSGKIMTAVAAAILLASTGLASAQAQAPRHDGAMPNGYYNAAPNQIANDPTPDWSNGIYPFPVTGQAGF